ncbi:MAG: inorganic phosphate transporter [Bacteroidales bacterium]|nr:inorganic phosphate transporter [Bacteroidales bacterium]
MEAFFLLIVFILIVLAVSDLVVGVSNDAVNFLNSAIGSKAAPFIIIMIIAAAGIVFGATFSSGMMEVARKGIFHPDQFFFGEIMIIFLAVMMTDIILLDFFNTFALPTSTTVSIVFELLGAAVAISIIKIHASGSTMADMSQYINTSSALLMITAILLSVVIAFTVGLLIQYLVRVMFSFDFEKNIKYFGALWGGIAISAITFFILIKGAKGSSFLTQETVAWIRDNSILILGISFVGWTVLLQLLQWIFRMNILKFIVLIGTFALAMAFAGNDLVNFIGVPLAGLESFRAFQDSGMADPSGFAMTALTEPVKTPTVFLLIAGAIMVLALWTSKKAKSVSATTIDLSRQDEGYERFESFGMARGIVRASIGFSNFLNMLIPKTFTNFLRSRFKRDQFRDMTKDKGLSFDLVRASVNLVVASALISLGTSLKLPLSTTYVTFMVAMGSSLADGAWGRESAVFRVSGVVTVIGGWFFTAFCAFTGAFLLAFLIHWGQVFAVVGLLVLIIFFFVKSYSLHRKRDAERKHTEEVGEIEGLVVNRDNVQKSCTKTVYKTLSQVSILYSNSISGIIDLKRPVMKQTLKAIKSLNKEIKILKDNIYQTISKLQEDDVESGHHYVQVLDYLRETAHCLTFIADPVFEYIDNNHPALIKDQEVELRDTAQHLNEFFTEVIKIIKNEEYSALDKVISRQTSLLDIFTKLKKKQLKRIKNRETGMKSSTIYLNTLTESKNLVLYTINLLKAQRDFVVYNNENGTKVLKTPSLN